MLSQPDDIYASVCSHLKEILPYSQTLLIRRIGYINNDRFNDTNKLQLHLITCVLDEILSNITTQSAGTVQGG